MSIASRISLGMSDKDKEWIDSIFPIKNLQPNSPGFDSGISGVSLDSDHQNGESDFSYKNPYSVESVDLSSSAGKSDGNIMDGNNSLYPDFDMLVGSPPTTDPYQVSDLPSNSSNLPLIDEEVFILDMFDAPDQPIPTAPQSSLFDCGAGSSISTSRDFGDFHPTTTSAINNQLHNNVSASTSIAMNHYVFGQNNTSCGTENENTISVQANPHFSDERINLMDNEHEEEDMDETDSKEKSRLLRNKKNADMARANRKKKKDHLQNLETKLQDVTEDNEKLKAENAKLLSEMGHRNQRIEYLENILANHSALSQVLDYVPAEKKIHLSSEFSSDQWSRFSAQNRDQNNGFVNITNNNNRPHPHTAGICLHFKPNNHISLEFCVKCSESSQMSYDQNQGQFTQNQEFHNS